MKSAEPRRNWHIYTKLRRCLVFFVCGIVLFIFSYNGAEAISFSRCAIKGYDYCGDGNFAEYDHEFSCEPCADAPDTRSSPDLTWGETEPIPKAYRYCPGFSDAKVCGKKWAIGIWDCRAWNIYDVYSGTSKYHWEANPDDKYKSCKQKTKHKCLSNQFYNYKKGSWRWYDVVSGEDYDEGVWVTSSIGIDECVACNTLTGNETCETNNGEFDVTSSGTTFGRKGVKTCTGNEIPNDNRIGCKTCGEGTKADNGKCVPADGYYYITGTGVDTTNGTALIQTVTLKIVNGPVVCSDGYVLANKENAQVRIDLAKEKNKNSVNLCHECATGVYTSCNGGSFTEIKDEEQGWGDYTEEYKKWGKKPSGNNNDDDDNSGGNGGTLIHLETHCVAGEIYVNGNCVRCNSNPAWVKYAQEWRMYCPGYYLINLDKPLKQLQKCPRGSWPNADLSNCECKFGTPLYHSYGGKPLGSCNNIKLSVGDLQCGPGGCGNKPLYKQCWTKNTAVSYRACMGFDN